MPIKTRIDMLATGIKTPVGIKIAGPDLKEIERIGKDVERVVRQVPGTASAYSERVAGGRYVVADVDRVEGAAEDAQAQGPHLAHLFHHKQLGE